MKKEISDPCVVKEEVADAFETLRFIIYDGLIRHPAMGVGSKCDELCRSVFESVTHSSTHWIYAVLAKHWETEKGVANGQAKNLEDARGRGNSDKGHD
jgi:hypothetical protein